VTNPGVLQVRRFSTDEEFIGDAIYDETSPLPERFTIVDPTDPIRRKHLPLNAMSEDLLIPVLRKGELVCELPSLDAIRKRVKRQLAMLHPGIKRFDNPHQYPAGLELSLHNSKSKLILEARGET
jgi:nicotinate phosphoribosyltransferase